MFNYRIEWFSYVLIVNGVNVLRCHSSFYVFSLHFRPSRRPIVLRDKANYDKEQCR